MGLGTWRSTRIPRSPNLVVGLGDQARSCSCTRTARVLRSVNDTLDGPHPSATASSRAPRATRSRCARQQRGLPPRREALRVRRRRYQPYDTRTGTTNTSSTAVGALAARGAGARNAGSRLGDDRRCRRMAGALSWRCSKRAVGSNSPRRRRARERNPQVALAVINAESGVGPDAYHPAGRYGLLQLTADQLRRRLARAARGVPTAPPRLSGPCCGTIWLRQPVEPMPTRRSGGALLLPGEDRTNWAVDTVIASPTGPRPELRDPRRGGRGRQRRASRSGTSTATPARAATSPGSRNSRPACSNSPDRSLDAVELQAARRLAATGTLAPRAPRMDRAVVPARALVGARDRGARAGDLLLVEPDGSGPAAAALASSKPSGVTSVWARRPGGRAARAAAGPTPGRRAAPAPAGTSGRAPRCRRGTGEPGCGGGRNRARGPLVVALEWAPGGVLDALLDRPGEVRGELVAGQQHGLDPRPLERVG